VGEKPNAAMMTLRAWKKSLAQDEINAIMQGNLAEANPILLASIFIQAPIFLLGWPIWLLWTGRLFLKGKLAIPESNEPVPQKV
jgi:hypothetical protein